MPREGSIGKETFEQVEALTKQGKSKTEAFAQIASDTGRNQGTVSANYYRVARNNGAVKPRKRRSKTVTRSPRPRGAATTRRASNGSEIDRLTSDLLKSVTALADAVKTQEVEVSSLRARLDGVRQAIS